MFKEKRDRKSGLFLVAIEVSAWRTEERDGRSVPRGGSFAKRGCRHSLATDAATARAWQKAARRAKKSTHRSECSFVSANDRLALGELRCATSGLQTVLLKATRRKPLCHKGLRVWAEDLTSNLTSKVGSVRMMDIKFTHRYSGMYFRKGR